MSSQASPPEPPTSSPGTAPGALPSGPYAGRLVTRAQRVAATGADMKGGTGATHATSTSQSSHTGTATSEPASTPAGQAGGARANALRTSMASDATNQNSSLTQRELDQAFGIERTVSQEQALANVDARLVATRDTLGAREGYLGNAGLRDEVKWLQDNRMQRLVTSAAMRDVEEALAMYALNDNCTERLPDPADSAELTAIVRINPENCFMQADSYWTSEASSGPLEKAKLRFQGTMPTRPHILQ
ncbi:hypothetical protein OBBRIDRAFT_836311 [Obba rivulosa]|uniref:Uncharacterized protein n=1 Tax=Obba rivulosa TaxID=1052685 RepID=A0A8E2AVD6_9APHY|nr:hypothetical protein OBBRIDRAFT_836311 [Obba rivulosa]